VIYLTLPELLHVAERTLGPDYAVRDYGLLEAALARPRATAFGKDAYPDLDGNKRLALAGVIAFYGLNGRRLTLTNDAAYDLVISVAAGHLDTVDAIAAILQTATRPWRLGPNRHRNAALPLPERRLGVAGHRRVETAGCLQIIRFGAVPAARREACRVMIAPQDMPD
jgi:death-on-curing protein